MPRSRVRYRSQIATIEVIDTGIGIAAQDRDADLRAVRARRHSPAALAQSGVGLGLAITQVLTRIMGGDIAVSERAGRGQPLHAAHHAARAARRRRRWARRCCAVTGYDGRAADACCWWTTIPRSSRSWAGCSARSASTVHIAGRRRPRRCAIVETPHARRGVARHPDAGRRTGGRWPRELRERASAPTLRIVMVSANAHEFRSGGQRARRSTTRPSPNPSSSRNCSTCVRGAARPGVDGARRHRRPSPARRRPAFRDGVSGGGRRLHLTELRRLGRIGHVRGIARKLDEMEAADPASRPLAAELRARVDAFDLKSVSAASSTSACDG